MFKAQFGNLTYSDVAYTITTRIVSSGAFGLIVADMRDTDKTICLNSKVNGKQPSLEHRIYDSSGNSTAITTGFLPNIAEPQICAMRGRNPDNPSERAKSNGRYKQRIEMNENSTSNTITSVQKDNLVVEPKVEQVGNVHPDTERFKNRTMGRVYGDSGLSPTINCCGGGDREPKILEPKYRIRKLTPRECFRLMDVSESDIDKIQNHVNPDSGKPISNSQQYKMAGNSIVVNNLFHIFRTLFIEKENPDLQMTIFDVL